MSIYFSIVQHRTNSYVSVNEFNRVFAKGEDSCSPPLSELPSLCGGNAKLFQFRIMRLAQLAVMILPSQKL